MTQMTINKNPHDLTSDELAGMNTRQLLALLDRSRSKTTCGCPSHCGDDALAPDELAHNQRQAELGERVKAALAGREHVPSSAEAKAERQATQGRPEKKAMRY